MSTNDWASWQRSLRCSPIPMAPLFQPISGIIGDPVERAGLGLEAGNVFLLPIWIGAYDMPPLPNLSAHSSPPPAAPRSGARSVAERARPDHLRRSVNLSAATCCRISSRDTEGPVRLRILLAVIGTLSRCSAWMATSIVSIFHFGITWLVMIASHSAAHVSPLARASSKPR